MFLNLSQFRVKVFTAIFFLCMVFQIDARAENFQYDFEEFTGPKGVFEPVKFRLSLENLRTRSITIKWYISVQDVATKVIENEKLYEITLAAREEVIRRSIVGPIAIKKGQKRVLFNTAIYYAESGELIKDNYLDYQPEFNVD